ncbi:arginase family protein [Cellulomonas sp. PS-H5]|uniref:arginase family protein n=1 Tax=Cellulomonas sp. PS-H5 TaxID=2820400 RepID=UPI001C4E9CBE|nr:arginase family protein [Cellulomonas sp. PS-H5]MBW0255871.1 arginase family protein [Cellulomonas sp. PS-H5]
MSQRIRLIEVPYDSGRRGVRHGAGPEALVAAGASARLGAHGADVGHAVVTVPGGFAVEAAHGTAAMGAVAREVAEHPQDLPVVLAGNCGATLGVLAGLRAQDPGRRVAVLWCDAHGDLQLPGTSTSGFFDGMALAMATGRTWQRLAASVPGHAPVPDERVLHVGGHDLDDAERALLTTSRIGRLGVPDVRAGRTTAALDALAAHSDAVHVHVDLDVHDPSVAPANGYAAPGGLLPEEVRDVIAGAAARLPLASATVASWDPACDVGHRMRGTALDLLGLLGGLAG